MTEESGGAPPLFRFVQFEFPWVLGPEPGRYVMRDHASEAELRVVVVATLEAAERRGFLRRRRAKKADPLPDPVMVPTSRATLIRGHPVGEEEAKAFLATAEPDALVEGELALLNRVLHLHRVASADPYVREASRDQALVVRVGYGSGEEVADGHWTEAVEPPETSDRRRREAALRPQERLAALLGGRDAALACEELILRARADLDGGRLREAALQLSAALDAAIAELEAWKERRDLTERLGELRDARESVEAAADEALRRGLSDDAAMTVTHVIGRVEAALRARTASGIT